MNLNSDRGKIVSMGKTKVNETTGKLEELKYGDENGIVSNQFADNLLNSDTDLSGVEIVCISDETPNTNNRSY